MRLPLHGLVAPPLTIIGSFVSPYVRKVLACMNLKGLAYRGRPDHALLRQ